MVLMRIVNIGLFKKMLTKLVTAILQNYFPFVIKNQTFDAKKCNSALFEAKIASDGLLFGG
ncbi:hypothetical protein DVG78_03090 [Runella aurantiaca]|uniref:Uncharacterized protein n=1 Tax=Runella aurantiaca TaxID=2282308 RepID=A0A369IN35_9BACT|nr:hypothetical protein DVG78_03090 [Runella aurantiaca]